MALNTCTLVPKSDPNVPSHVHRLMKAVALVQLLQIPQFAQFLSAKDILDRVLMAMKEDPSGIRIDPAPPSAQPSPEMLTAAAKLKDADTKAQKVQVDAAKVATESQDRQAELQGEKDVETVRLAQTLVAHAHDAKNADRTSRAGCEQTRAGRGENGSRRDDGPRAIGSGHPSGDESSTTCRADRESIRWTGAA